MDPVLNLTGCLTTRTLGDAVGEARALLNDPAGSGGPSLSGTATGRTVGGLVHEVRLLLNDPQDSTGPSLSGTTVVRTVGSIVAKARGFLNDTVPAYRYSDADLYGYVSDALLQVRRFRPDLFTSGVLDALPAYLPTDAAQPFPVAEEYQPAFIQYVVASAELRDDPFTVDAKVSTLLEGFLKGLERSPFRYSDAQLYSYVSDALLQARRLRPDLFVAGGDNLPSYTPASAGVAFPVFEVLYPCFVQYVMGMAMARNDLAVGGAAMDTALKAIAAAPLRYSDDRLYALAGDALLELRRIRPDLFLSFGLRRALPRLVPADAPAPFPLDDRYYPAVISYIVAMGLARDGGLKRDDNAAAYLSLFSRQALS